MPFDSKSQMRWMFANKPKMAKRWAAHTPNIKALPKKVKGTYTDPRHSHPYSYDPIDPGRCLICGQEMNIHSIK